MRIRAPLFCLELSATSPLDEGDLGGVLSQIRTSTFSGGYTAWLKGEDLERFARALRGLIDDPRPLQTATLSTASSSIEVCLTMRVRGRIDGSDCLQPESPDTMMLSGTFLICQSFVPMLRQSVVDLRAAPRPPKPA